MIDPANGRSDSGRWLLLGAACLLIGGGGLFAWRSFHPQQQPREQQSLRPIPDSVRSTRDEAPLPQKETAKRSAREPESSDESAERQMGSWLADADVSPPEAARRIWRIAIDPNYSQAVRKDALANALNLAEDLQLQDEFLGDLSRSDTWAGDLGEALLDDLYNRSNGVKVAAIAALLPGAEGDFREHLREVLRFQLEAADADDSTLIRLAAAKTGEPEKSTDGQ